LIFDSAAGDIGSQIADAAFQGLQGVATAATMLTSLMPAGAEEVSAQAVAAFATEAAQLLALNQAAQEELMRAGQAVAEIARMYSEADATAAGSLVGVGLLWGDRLAGV
jgi:hypothetical protein